MTQIFKIFTDATLQVGYKIICYHINQRYQRSIKLL